MTNFIKKFFISFLIILLIITGIYHSKLKKLPAGINYISPAYYINDNEIEFLYDLTYEDNNGKIMNDQNIFKNVYNLIDNAEDYILIDMFLFNSLVGKSTINYLKITGTITEKLIEKKRNIPGIKIDFITDPINTVYGGAESLELADLKKNGINVILADLTQLRDSNKLYSPVWRLFIKPFGNNKGGSYKHPFTPDEKVSLRSYLSLLNFKANHRKVIVADNNGTYVTIISSANPHDASSFHSNVAVKITGDFAQEIYNTEKAVSLFSKKDLTGTLKTDTAPDNKKDSENRITLATENRIEKALLKNINDSKTGDQIKIAVFYLSNRKIINALKKAAKNGAEIKIILDQNKDAFGFKKNGTPNVAAANKLIKQKNIQIKWYNTHGEQFHTKLSIFQKANGKNTVIMGSANLTKRNLGNLNLEMNIIIENEGSRLTDNIINYYNKIWNNTDGKYTLNYDKNKKTSFNLILLYWLQETTGFCSY